jgi:transcriptional regulator with XRE-family HTH domain
MAGLFMKQVKPTPFPANPVLSDPGVLGHAVRAARTEAGMTLAEAAMSIGVAKQTLSNLENGQAGVSLGLVLKITEALGLSLAVFARHQQDKVSQTIHQSMGQVKP